MESKEAYYGFVCYSRYNSRKLARANYDDCTGVAEGEKTTAEAENRLPLE